TRIEKRELVWQTASAAQRASLAPAAIEPAAFDAWAPPPDLAHISKHNVACGECHGSGRAQCAKCDGSSRVACVDCDGSGKYYGVAANGARRLLNCKGCRGKGSVTCHACTRGLVVCGSCDGTTKLSRWLEVAIQPRVELRDTDSDMLAA